LEGSAVFAIFDGNIIVLLARAMQALSDPYCQSTCLYVCLCVHVCLSVCLSVQSIDAKYLAN